MYRQITGLLAAACMLCLAGCVCTPVKSPTQNIRQDELDRDVRFLAQPALKGRKPGSWQSSSAIRFLTERFRQYGLVPWAQCTDYKLPFRFGTNVVGVLPGSDPSLADEIILVSAHYDHLGVQKGKIHFGAADNASGVAAMLEIAESLSLSETKLKRPVCFAAFDSEELGCLGSFAFTCRKDYDDSKIVAVVNIDILGRNLLDSVRNSLLLVGTEQFRKVEHQIMDFGRQADLKVLPVAASLVGPVGDHAAFVSNQRPVLFFTSGIYNDYHQPTDTPERLDLELLHKETSVVQQAVCLLANAETFDAENSDDKSDEHLNSLLTILQQIQDNQRVFDPDSDTANELNKLVLRTQEKMAGQLSAFNSVAFQRDTINQLLGLLKDYNPILAQYSQKYMDVSKYYSLNPPAFTAAFRQVVRHYLERGVPVVGGRYTYQRNMPITEQDWTVSKVRDDQYVFSAVKPQVCIRSQLSILGKKNISLQMGGEVYYCKGSLDQLGEYIFLQAFKQDPAWIVEHSHPGTVENKDPSQLSSLETSKENAQAWLDLLSKFQLQYPAANADSLIHQDLRERGPQIKKWLLSSMKSGNPDIAKTAISIASKLLGEAAETELRGILADAWAPVDVREAAVYALAKTNKKENLISILEALDDATLCPIENVQLLDTEYAFREHLLIAAALPHFKEWYDKQKPQPLGQIAADQLTKITKQRFGSDKGAWEQWIRKNYKI